MCEVMPKALEFDTMGFDKLAEITVDALEKLPTREEKIKKMKHNFNLLLSEAFADLAEMAANRK